jgi:hypothetical protein
MLFYVNEEISRQIVILSVVSLTENGPKYSKCLCCMS